jgi:Putative lumazine-binding
MGQVETNTLATEKAAIEVLVQTYLDGLYEGDPIKIASAFHSTSALAQMHEGQLQITPRNVWLEGVRTRPSPKSRGLARHDEVLSIDIAGPTMAFVKLKCAIPPRFFTDQLSLLKIDGRWQVAQKVFQTETR